MYQSEFRFLVKIMSKIWFHIVQVNAIWVTMAWCLKLDSMDCGVDHEVPVMTGSVPIDKYPWIGVLYYDADLLAGEAQSVTTVALIHREFVIANAADFELIPKHDLRRKLRVLLGERWPEVGRRVRNYVTHAEYAHTRHTLALVQLKDYIADAKVKPPCFVSGKMKNLVFYIIKFKEDYTELKKEVLSATHIPADLCNEYYAKAKAPIFSVVKSDAFKSRPMSVACAVSLEENVPCVWNAGAALVVRDVWGRWQLLGVGVGGLGCGAPARFLELSSYVPWIVASLDRFQRATIVKVNKHKYILRSGTGLGLDQQRFAECSAEEKNNCLSIEQVKLNAEHLIRQNYTYNLTISANIEYTCLTLELVKATAASEIRIRHVCPRAHYEESCHFYRGSTLTLSVDILFTDECLFEMYAWGFYRPMRLLNIQEWKWEESIYYNEFYPARGYQYSEPYITEYGYEPLDNTMWLPDNTFQNKRANSNKTNPKKSKSKKSKQQKTKNPKKGKKKEQKCILCDLLKSL